MEPQDPFDPKNLHSHDHDHDHGESDMPPIGDEVDLAAMQAALQEAQSRVFWFYLLSVPSVLLVLAAVITRKWGLALGYPVLLASSGAIVDNMELVVPALRAERRHQVMVGTLLGLSSGSLALLGAFLFVDAILKPDVRNLLMGLGVFVFSARTALLSLKLASGAVTVDDFATKLKMRPF